ncbi:hypothetical protein LTR86_006084 [Recurvomyces mirabilis]|nr:hypothetical protein LTR86_006084 [Recurvomyces mirabilis]
MAKDSSDTAITKYKFINDILARMQAGKHRTTAKNRKVVSTRRPAAARPQLLPTPVQTCSLLEDYIHPECSLLTLPPELRLVVYDLIFYRPADAYIKKMPSQKLRRITVTIHSGQPASVSGLAKGYLTHINRQIRHEASRVIYGRGVFHIDLLGDDRAIARCQAMTDAQMARRLVDALPQIGYVKLMEFNVCKGMNNFLVEMEAGLASCQISKVVRRKLFNPMDCAVNDVALRKVQEAFKAYIYAAEDGVEVRQEVMEVLIKGFMSFWRDRKMAILPPMNVAAQS